jgi:hypothetical protein
MQGNFSQIRWDGHFDRFDDCHRWKCCALMLISPEELSDIHHSESKESFQSIGAEVNWMGFFDGMIFDDISTCLSFVTGNRKTCPDLILTHNPVD